MSSVGPSRLAGLARDAVSPAEITDALQYVGLILTNSLPRLAIETSFFALYSVLAVPSCWLVLRRGLTTLSEKLVAAACAVMYLVALIHYILTFHWIFVDNDRSNALRDTIINCVHALDSSAASTTSCTLDVAYSRPTLAADNDVAFSVLLLISIVLSSAVLLWRVCVLWSKSLAVKIISGLLLFCTALMLAISAGLSPSGGTLVEVAISSTTIWSEVGTEFADVFGTTGITFVFLITLFVTILVSVKAWQNRKIEREDTHTELVSTRSNRVVIFILESGIIYCLFWVLLIASFVEWDWPYNSTKQHYLDAIVNLKASALIDIVGLYPTLLVVLRELSNPREKTLYQVSKV